jgi:hypothetical protein
VDSAQGTLALIVRNAALHQSWIKAVRFELPLAPAPSEKSPIVFQPVGLYDECTFELGLGEDHEKTLTSGIGTTN